ncbi:hypothetical protein OG618_34180 [Kitasatospora sp. NBC_01246]|uniref:hypothetical protein n=1 Tax=Kitasatospora sp. NBC_01246 TaxID=2903570 RepID=UPI002E2F62D8|nr:hypothetical protein [Kitasatospora sp. NBC_01246]
MAAAQPPRRGPRAAARGSAVAVLGLLVALAGCATPGELRDAGAARPVTPSPKPQPLWPTLAAAPSPTSPAASETGPAEPPPVPVPGVAVPGPDLTSVDLGALLSKDPALSAEERRALTGCPDCAVRDPEFRDLTGDGRPELIAAVATGGSVVLHVYTLGGGGVVPVLRVAVLRAFSAETLAADLWLNEATTPSSRTISHYGWNGTRLVLLEQRVEAIGPVTAPGHGPTPADRPSEPAGAAQPSAAPFSAKPAVSPSSGVSQPRRPDQAVPVPAPRPGTAVPTPAPPTPAAPEAKR